MSAASDPIAPNDLAIARPRWQATWLRGSAWLLFLPALAVLAPCFLLPVGKLLLTSFGRDGWSLSFYAQALTNPTSTTILLRTIVLAGEVTAFTTLIGYPVAYMIYRTPAGPQKLLILLLVLPLWISVLVRSFAFIVLLGRDGVLNHAAMLLGLENHPTQMLFNRFSVVVGFIHVMIPLFVFPVLSVMKRIPPGLMATGMSLGARRSAAFWLIFFPLSLPGVASGAILVFVLSIGFLVTPTLLGGLGDTTYVMLIKQEVDTLMNWPLAAAMSVILMSVTLTLVIVFGRFLRLANDSADHSRPVVKRSGAVLALATEILGRYSALRQRARAVDNAGWFVRVWTILTLIFLLGPIVILFPLGLDGASYLQFPPPSLSFRWYANYFARDDWTAATKISFEVAFFVMLTATFLGTAAAIAARRTPGIAAKLVLSLVICPIFIPTVVTAVAIYFEFVVFHLIGSVLGMVLAHTVIAVPIVVIIVSGALTRANIGPERAALSLGAGPIRAFLATTLVAIRPSILTAALFAFLCSFDENIIALFISGTNPTLPKRMWDAVSLEVDPTLAAISSMLILLSIAIVLSVEFIRRRMSPVSTAPP
jgi:putative spermidine/putrescine transport system permease protein